MKYFTKKWDDYINNEWKDFLGLEKINVVAPDELYDGEFSISLLEEEFEKYYNAKKKYVSMYDYFEKEFGEYEEIELLSREEEYKKYIDRVNDLIFEARNKIRHKVAYSRNSNSNDYNIDDIDFKLLALGKVNIKTRDTYRKIMYSNEMINRFGEEIFRKHPTMYRMSLNKILNDYDSFCSENNIRLPNEELEQFYYHDARISFYGVTNDNIILDIDSDWDYNASIKLEFIKANITEDLSEDMRISHNNIDIFTADIRYYIDLGYYFFLELIIQNYDTGVIECKNVTITSKDIITTKHDTNK